MEPKTIIGVFCYKRAAKLKTSIEALLKNPECSEMEIIFFCDGYKGENDKEGVLETRRYIDSITGFKKVHKQYRERNYSTGPNFHAALTYLSQNYDQFIIVEDDVVVMPNYIRFLLDALKFYKEEKSVFAITGYCFPIEKENYPFDSIIHKRFCSYGWASWGDRVSKVKWDASSLQSIISTNPGFTRKLNQEGMDLSRMLHKQIDGRISTWDIQMQVHVALHDMLVVYPVISKTTNIGFDTESTNTFGVDYLKTPLDSGEKRSFKFCSVTNYIPALSRQLKKPYSFASLSKRKIANTFIKYSNQLKHKLA
jgi:hypothetical protein